MNNSNRIYAVEENVSALGVQYFFVSNGESNIIKIIDYKLFDIEQGELIYNLAFGDYDIRRNVIIDDINTNNGDAYLVLNTVLNTIPLFFDRYPDVTLMVQGSDSISGFPDLCRGSCRKNCNEVCKNADRRISVYMHFVNKNFTSLSKEYIFSGDFTVSEAQKFKEDYVPGKKYRTVFVRKKA